MSIIVHSGTPSGVADPVAASGVTPGMVLEVANKETIADGVALLTLVAPSRLPPWLPGAHIDVTGPTGIERQYSLCGNLDDPRRWQVAVLRESTGRGGSEALHANLVVGDRVHVRGPRNRFRLTSAKRYCFVAGGIGITPILSMVRLVEASERPWTLSYSGRSRSTMAFLPELTRYGGKVTLHPADEGARAPLDELLADLPAGTAVFACGPPRLVDAVTSALESEPDMLHVERFAAREDVANAASGRAFDVELRRSGRTIQVPDGTTLLEAVRDAGVTAPASCCEGVCGTCEVQVLAGTPDHRDSILTTAERAKGDSMFICVSRAASDRLVLDL